MGSSPTPINIFFLHLFPTAVGSTSFSPCAAFVVCLFLGGASGEGNEVVYIIPLEGKNGGVRFLGVFGFGLDDPVPAQSSLSFVYRLSLFGIATTEHSVPN